MKNYLLNLAKINMWQNEKLRAHFKEHEVILVSIVTPYGSFKDLIYHIYGAIEYWLRRTNGTWMEFDVTKEKRVNTKSFQELLLEWKKMDEFWISEMEKLPNSIDQTSEITYKNLKGISVTMKILDAISHLSHHCFYHKGQLALLIRQNNLPQLPPLDAIYYYLMH